MSKRTVLLFSALIIAIGLLVTIALSQRNGITPGKLSTPTTSLINEGHTLLSLVPNTSSTPASVNVDVDSGRDNLTAVQLELSYDPQMLTDVVITSGSYFTNSTVLLNKIDTKNGKISYAIAIPPSGAVKQGQGTVATISFKSNLQAGAKTEIKFLPSTIVTAKGVKESVLKSALGTVIVK